MINWRFRTLPRGASALLAAVLLVWVGFSALREDHSAAFVAAAPRDSVNREMIERNGSGEALNGSSGLRSMPHPGSVLSQEIGILRDELAAAELVGGDEEITEREVVQEVLRTLLEPGVEWEIGGRSWDGDREPSHP